MSLLRKCLWTSTPAPAWFTATEIEAICMGLAEQARQCERMANDPGVSEAAKAGMVKVAKERTELALRILDARDAEVVALVHTEVKA